MQPTSLKEDKNTQTQSFLNKLKDLYIQQTTCGFVDISKLNNNTELSYSKNELSISHRIIINYMRATYADTVVNNNSAATCPLCLENNDLIGQPLKRSLQISINSELFNIALTPYPSFKKHFVIASADHQPMRMDSSTVDSALALSHILNNEFHIFCNSDNKLAGASIEQHHHYQAIPSHYIMPVEQALPVDTYVVDTCQIDYLSYPLATIKISANNPDKLSKQAKHFLNFWRQLYPNNTCNVWLSSHQTYKSIYFFLRHPSNQVNPKWHDFKQEGIGIIEACGLGIFPVPNRSNLTILKNNGDHILSEILKCISPNCSDILQQYKRYIIKEEPTNNFISLA